MKNTQNQKNSVSTAILLFALLLSFSNAVQALQVKNAPLVTGQQDKAGTQPAAKDTVYSFVEKMPQFPGGEKEVLKFLSKTTVYPAEAQKNGEHGKVIVQFIIGKTGKVEDAKVLKGVSKDLDAEALRVIGLLPDWTPGEQNGEKVAVYRIIPIMFQNVSPEDAWEVNEKTVVVIDNVKMPANFNPTVLNFNQFGSVNVLKPFPEKEKSGLMSKYGKQAENGVILLTRKTSEIQYSLPDSTLNPTLNKNTDCKENVVVPVYPGGEEKLMRYIADSIQYPFVAQRTKTEGKVYVRFLVNTSGKVSDVALVHSADYFLGKEAIRVVSTLPDWTPAAKCDKKINILVTMPVTFKLNLPVKEKGWERNSKTIVLLDGERLPASFQLEWLRYENLSGYQVLQPTSKEVTKKLVSKYGRDAVNGVILIGSRK